MRRRPRLRALVLCAGYGSRLRPLTLAVPKPLLPVCGSAVVVRTLQRLAAIGCRQAAINLHHLPAAFPRELDGRVPGIALRYAREEAEIQGTLGALYPLRDWLGEADAALVINGDALCSWPLRRLLRRHLRRRADATLLLHRRVLPAAYGGGVGIDRDGRVVAMRDAPPVGAVARRAVFTGAHVLSPRLLRDLAPGPADIVAQLYLPLLAAGGRIESVLTGRRWHDLGTPGRLLAGILDVARGWRPRWWWRGARVAASARVDPGAALRRTVVEARARIEAETRLEEVVVLPSATIGRGSRLRRTIIGPGVVLPPATVVEQRMVCVAPTGYQPADRESMLGTLVYTPL